MKHRIVFGVAAAVLFLATSCGLAVCYGLGSCDSVATTTTTPPAAAFTPKSLSDLSVWYSASTLSLSDGDRIETWADSSENQKDLSQSTAINKPVYRSAGTNSKPAVEFAASAPYYEVHNSTIAISQPLTVVAVGTAAGGVTIQFLFDGLSSRLAAWTNWPTASGLTLWAGHAAGGASGYVGISSDSTPKLLVMEYALGNATAWINGVAGAIVPVGTQSLGGLVLGTNTASTALGYIKMSEFMIYSRSLSSTERGQIQDYLNTVYSLY